MMAKYRNRKNEVEAFQMTQARRWDNSEWPNWLNQAWQNEPGRGSVYIDPDDAKGEYLLVGVEGGFIPVRWGGFITRDTYGELSAVGPDVFMADYEEVKNETPRDWQPAEAIIAFAAWLTTRDEVIVMGASQDAAPAAEVVERFRLANGILPVRDDFPSWGTPEDIERPQCGKRRGLNAGCVGINMYQCGRFHA